MENLREKNVLLIMQYIIDNNIINIRYFINKELKLNYNTYLKCLLRIERKYPDIYYKYKQVVDNNYNMFKENAKAVFLYILILKKYGIELEDGTFRKFDIFDYYVLKNKYLYNFSKKDLLPVYEELLRDIMGVQNNLNTLELRMLISSTTGYNIANYDSVDLPISDKTIIMLEDGLSIGEKEFLIDFMQKHQIPFTFGNYNFGIEKIRKQRETKNNIFNINDDLKDIKKKIK